MSQKRDKKDLKFEVSDFENSGMDKGPVEERSCTDILCCLLFIANWLGLWVLAGYAFKNGRPAYLAAVYDSDGAACGLNATYESYPYIYFPRPIDNYSESVCVATCPNYADNASAPTSLACHTNSVFSNCVGNDDISDPNTLFLIYNTTTLLDRFCFPADDLVFSNSTYANFTTGILEQGGTSLENYVRDAKTVWPMYFAAGGFALLFGLIFMLFMRYCSGIVTWLFIIIALCSLACLGWLCYDQYKALSDDSSNGGNPITTAGDEETNSSDSSSFFNTDEVTNNKDAMLGLSIFFWSLFVVFLILILCMFTQIRLAIAILQTAADFLKDTPQTLIIPLIKIAQLGLFIAWWIVVFLYIYSIGTFTQRDGTPFFEVTWTTNTRYALIYHIFGLFWNCAFIMAVGEFCIASCAAIWYFGQGPGSQGVHSPLSRSLWRAYRYHLGSLAFGSLILAIIQTIRVILAYFQAQAAKAGNNKCMKYTLDCLQCCLACFERFIEFLNRNAYIQIAIKGSNFCTAAKDAFYLIWTNPIRFSALAGVGAVFLFIGKLFITIGPTMLMYVIITRSSTYKNAITSPIVPTCFFFCIAYVISVLIVSVYSMGADTILQCYCLDEEIHSKRAGVPMYAPEPLRAFIKKVEDDNHPNKS